MEIRKRMQSLVDELNMASDAYYSGDNQLMPDAIWDAKFDELKLLEIQSGVVLDNSPTHNVSHENIVGEKIAHEYPTLSLPKSKNISDVVNWADNRQVNLSWKLDGMTLVVTYDAGKLEKIVTRGDGEIGSNITHLADAIGNLPNEIDYKGKLVIRGEAIICYNDFEILNSIYDKAYENPRNLVAGSLNPLTKVDLILDRHIQWIPFTLVYIDNNILFWKDRMMFLKSLGFQVVESEYISNVEFLPTRIDSWSKRVDSIVYPVDGLVVVYDDTEYASGGLLTGHHDTRGGFAFKWPDQEAVTKLIDIEWSVSINSINPVAIFEPVRLEGTTVKRASLCNISECERLGIGATGTALTVIKSNKIIPKVIKAKKVGQFSVPDKCPICDHATNIKTSTTDAKVLICENKDCPAKNIRKMSRFVSKQGFDINGLSAQKLTDLLNRGLIASSMDILDLPNKREMVHGVLSNADGWGKKSIENLLQSIESAKSVKAENLLYALCIPMWGRDASKKLLKQRTLHDIVATTKYAIENKTHLSIDDTDGIGDVMLAEFINWFANNDNMMFVERLLSMCDVIDCGQATTSVLQGLTFVITGSLNNYESRNELKELIESMGGCVTSSVSSKTDYLINNDMNSTSSKNKKAQSLNIPIISECDFISRFLM